jgi:preprotein translocase subunit SecE
MSKTSEYLKEVTAEAKHITWPTRNQTIFYTIAVLVISAAIAYFLGAFDMLFSKGLQWLLTK